MDPTWGHGVGRGNAEKLIHPTGWGPHRLTRSWRGSYAWERRRRTGPASHIGLVAQADRVAVIGAEPGLTRGPRGGDDERVAAPCDEGVTSTRISNSRRYGAR